MVELWSCLIVESSNGGVSKKKRPLNATELNRCTVMMERRCYYFIIIIIILLLLLIFPLVGNLDSRGRTPTYSHLRQMISGGVTIIFFFIKII